MPLMGLCSRVLFACLCVLPIGLAAACGGPDFTSGAAPPPSKAAEGGSDRDDTPIILPNPVSSQTGDDEGDAAVDGARGDAAAEAAPVEDATIALAPGDATAATAAADGRKAANADAKDGSEVDGIAVAIADAGCAAGYASCDGGCAQLASDPHHCGACGNDCSRLPNVGSAGLACSAGHCAYQCATDYADCADSGTGCASSLLSVSHCGACESSCGTTAPACARADAGSYACTLVCPSATTNCSGTCADLASDPKNCGGCGMACAPGTRCSASHCVCDTTSGCNGCCGSGATCDPYASQSSASCGTGGGACAPCLGGETCDTSSGKCGCSGGQTLCAGACVNEQTDPANCGGCGIACGPGLSCKAAHCACDATSGCSGCCSSGATCEPYVSQSSASCGAGGAACAPCPASDGCHVPGACAVGQCAPSPPAPSTTACFTAPHATSALCDGSGNCRAVACANGYVDDQGTCKVPNCAGVACGSSDGAGGICTGMNGTCSRSGQHCDGAGQCVCDGMSCAGCCDANGQCNVSSDATCGVNGGACQTCDPLSPTYTTCSGASCKLVQGATGCVVDSDCVPGGCYNGKCLGTTGIAGQVSCGPANGRVLCPASQGCSYTQTGGDASNAECGTGNGSVILCDAPNDCGAGQDCCSTFTCGFQTTQQCYSQSTLGVAGSGCPVNAICASVSLVCDPRAATCP